MAPLNWFPSPMLRSDWEHVTVRLTPDGRHVVGIYYSCHRSASHLYGALMSRDTARHIVVQRFRSLRQDAWQHCHTRRLTGVMLVQYTQQAHAAPNRHIDGTWRSADEVPRTADGRPEAFVAINGHGSYPYPGRVIRLFGAFNDHTSRRGAGVAAVALCSCTQLLPIPIIGIMQHGVPLAASIIS
jgi:hypothetical protein